jgi:hypothetical protein
MSIIRQVCTSVRWEENIPLHERNNVAFLNYLASTMLCICRKIDANLLKEVIARFDKSGQGLFVETS